MSAYASEDMTRAVGDVYSVCPKVVPLNLQQTTWQGFITVHVSDKGPYTPRFLGASKQHQADGDTPLKLR